MPLTSFTSCFAQFLTRLANVGAILALFLLGKVDSRLLGLAYACTALLISCIILEIAIIGCPPGKLREIIGLVTFGGLRRPTCPWSCLGHRQRLVASLLSIFGLHDAYMIWTASTSENQIKSNHHTIFLPAFCMGDTVTFTSGENEGMKGTVMAVSMITIHQITLHQRSSRLTGK